MRWTGKPVLTHPRSLHVFVSLQRDRQPHGSTAHPSVSAMTSGPQTHSRKLSTYFSQEASSYMIQRLRPCLRIAQERRAPHGAAARLHHCDSASILSISLQNYSHHDGIMIKICTSKGRFVMSALRPATACYPAMLTIMYNYFDARPCTCEGYIQSSAGPVCRHILWN